MPYTKTTWVDSPATTSPVNAANLNNIESGVGNAPYGPDASANFVPVWNGTAWTYQGIKNAQVDAAAAIAGSKLATGLSGPPAAELAHNEITSNVSVTATTAATANTVVTSTAVTFDGATAVIVEFYAGNVNSPTTAGAGIIFDLWQDSTDLGFIAQITTPAAATTVTPVFARRKLTPSNASHTFSVRSWVTAGSGTVTAGVGGSGAWAPAFIRITKV